MFKYVVLSLFAWQANSTVQFTDGKPFIKIDDHFFSLESYELTPKAEARMRSKDLADKINAFKSTVSSRKHDLRDKMSPVKDQGARLTCSVFQTAGLVEQYLGNDDLSEQCLAHLSTGIDPGDPYLRLQFAVSNGLHHEDNCPYIDPRNYREWALADKVKRAELRQKAATTIPDLTDRNVVKVAAEIYSRNIDQMDAMTMINYVRNRIINGVPVGVATFVIGDDWSSGVIDDIPTDDEIAKMCPPNSQIDSVNSPKKHCGAHAIVVTGFDDYRGVFYFKNSWRETWGVNAAYMPERLHRNRIGYGVMSYEYFARFGVGTLLTLM